MVHREHGVGRLDTLDTFNALWRKAWDHGPNLPLFTPFNADVSFECLSVAHLAKFVSRKESRLPDPSFAHLPIVIGRLMGRRVLVDGHSRICMWRDADEFNLKLPCYVVSLNGD